MSSARRDGQLLVQIHAIRPMQHTKCSTVTHKLAVFYRPCWSSSSWGYTDRCASIDHVVNQNARMECVLTIWVSHSSTYLKKCLCSGNRIDSNAERGQHTHHVALRIVSHTGGILDWWVCISTYEKVDIDRAALEVLNRTNLHEIKYNWIQRKHKKGKEVK